ncbi:spore germination protein [Abyssisolibacter fermentans]|uniref:spore germination protein n=1 Tax=Abyssisolibacter fermentans TaxID=1766203 RepID=UPI00083070AA|nr:spore germination protein [Abyssisolibacter fermentans]
MFKIIKDKLFKKQSIKNNSKNEYLEWKTTSSLNNNIKLFKSIFINDDMIKYRTFGNSQNPNIRLTAIFCEGMSNGNYIDRNIIKPVVEAHLKQNDFEYIYKHVLIGSDIKKIDSVEDMVSSILYGDTLLLVDGYSEALILETKGWSQRSISEPTSETVVRGPKEGFNETLMTNLSLIRKKITNSDLKFKFKTLGERTKTKICVCYIDGIVNKNILNEVYKRLDEIKIDAILESGYVEELIKDSPFSPFSTVGNTERPDKVAANLLEGRVAIIIDGTPHALTVPFLFIEYFQANEDYYNGYIFSSINRMLRYLAFFISTSLPAIYVALTTFHKEMIPTPLLLSISSAREGVPLPTIAEILLMLLEFEILRESGIRLPAPIGSAISFVGALILGEATVAARFVSSPIVIITALTGICNFLSPQMIGALIVVRLVFVLLSAFLGLFGYIFGIIGLFIHLMSMKSFGVPYMQNITSFNFQDIKDTQIRAPWWLMYLRPKIIGENNLVRKEKKNNFTKR